MPNEIGPHLLGRKPSPPDPRDFSFEKMKTLARFDPAMLHQTVGDLVSDPDGPSHSYASWILFLRWLRTNGYAPSPFHPTPPPVDESIWWDDPFVLDQGDTGHCVGFTGADKLNAEPMPHNFTNEYGHELYYACKVIDGDPKSEEGSYVRSVMKALQQRGFIAAYASLKSISEIDEALKHSIVSVGTDWTEAMFDPDDDGRIHPLGDVAGGHAYSIEGDDGPDYIILNHWGDWGGSDDAKVPSGRAKISKDDFDKLLTQQGEAWAAIEIV